MGLVGGGALPTLAELATRYPRRYGQAHGHRFDKQDLLWADVRVRTPEHMERWSNLVAIVQNQLVLAAPRVAVERRPWESRVRPARPRHVRRAMGRSMAQVEPPARPPQRRGKAPGRAVGAVIKRAERQAVVRTTPPPAPAPPTAE